MPTPIEPVCGTQNIISRTMHPAKYSGCCGPGTLVATVVALRLNNSSASACTAGGAMPSAASRPKATIACREALQLVHAFGDALQPTHRIAFADRQVEEHQAEVVAEFLRVFQRTQVDRHGRAQGDAVDVCAAFEHVAAQRAGGRGHQHVVDGEVAVARPTALTSSRSSGSAQATRLLTPEVAAQQRRRIVGQARAPAAVRARSRCLPSRATRRATGSR